MGPNPTQGSLNFECEDSKQNLPRYRNQVTVDYAAFGEFLKRSIRDKRQVSYRVRTAEEYGSVLDSRDGSALQALPLHKRLYVMKTLSKLAKFQGQYAEWQQIRADFGLSWKEEDDVTAFKRMTESENIDDMIRWVKETRSIAPAYGKVLTYACLTGLRPAEVFLSLGLPNYSYFNAEKGLLEHYRRPDSFIRPKKKAFVSVMTNDLLRIRAKYDSSLTYNRLRLFLRRRDMKMNMQYCRKIYGTFLKGQGIDNELVDLLEGRLPRSVFLRFYNRPNFAKECERVREGIRALQKEIR